MKLGDALAVLPDHKTNDLFIYLVERPIKLI
jgi:hypothetical protein